MKIGITQRLFLSILAATSLAILCLFLIMRWNIDRGFYQYLGTLDQGRLEQIAERLGQAYDQQGSWDFLRGNPRLWSGRMLNQRPDNAASGMSGRFDQGNDAPFPPRGAHRPRWPFVVLDAERKPLLGSPADAAEASFRPIVRNGETVGYVGLLPPKHFLTPPQFQFLKQQKSTLIMAAFGMALVIAIVSLPLARRMVRPIRAMAAATHDIASGKYATRVPASSSDELGQLARDFNAMALTLEKHEGERRQWVADISHELRTPVAVLRGEIEALLDGVRTITPETVRSLHAETLRLGRLVDDLYQLSLSDIGALTYRKENLDLGEALRDSVESYRAEFGRKGVVMTDNLSRESGFTVFADRERLDQLFANLFENSLRYTDAGGSLVVDLAFREGLAVIEFRDSAPGVPEKELDRLFDRLYRVEGSRSRASGGAGLGLSICKNIVEGHEGTISAHPSPLGGLLIRITFPVTGRSA
jgi:two-component system sensor histidine kinase BaeS